MLYIIKENGTKILLNLLYKFSYFFGADFEVKVFDCILMFSQIAIEHFLRDVSQLFYVFFVFP